MFQVLWFECYICGKRFLPSENHSHTYEQYFNYFQWYMYGDLTTA